MDTTIPRAAAAPDDDPFAPGRDDPYPAYAQLRARGPFVYHERLGCWLATTAESVTRVLTDAAVFSSEKGIGLRRNEVILRPTMLTRDPPDHARLRTLAMRAFTPRRIAGLGDRIAAITTELLDDCLRRGEIDLVRDLARPLPIAVLAELLEVEPGRLPDLQCWADDIFASVAGLASATDRERVQQSYREFDDFFGAQIEARRRRPKDDLLSELIAAHDERAALTTTEILSFCMLLFIAGTETTTNLIANAGFALAVRPHVAARLRAHLTLVRGLVEETLRYDSPVQGIFRTTRTAVTIGGVTIDADQKVCALIASANRDTALYADADRFDVDRVPNPHIAFGHGPHYCLGAALARLETRIVVTELLRRTRSLGLIFSRTPRRLKMPLVRGFERLPLAVVENCRA